ncbi:MAG: 2-oxoacid:acceptor oxidoreductase subunit alpha, partial [Candidatus Heimdallarchaeota archaeon]
FITEDLETVRLQMVDKRMKRLEEIINESIPPCLLGSKEYKKLVIGWGSTFNALKEALENIDDDSLALLHFKQVYPIPPETKKYLEKAEKIIIVENNVTSQFGKLLKLYADAKIDHKILKFNGMPFSVEELTEKIKKIVED